MTFSRQTQRGRQWSEILQQQGWSRCDGEAQEHLRTRHHRPGPPQAGESLPDIDSHLETASVRKEENIRIFHFKKRYLFIFVIV